MKHSIAGSVNNILCALTLMLITGTTLISHTHAQGHDQHAGHSMPAGQKVKPTSRRRRGQRRTVQRKKGSRSITKGTSKSTSTTGDHQGHSIDQRGIQTPGPGQENHQQHTSVPAADSQSSGDQQHAAVHEGHLQKEQQMGVPLTQIQNRDQIIEQQRSTTVVERGGTQLPRVGSTQEASRPVLRLEDLEQLALKNSPTLAQTQAAIHAAEGRRRQAGLFPNPIIGYFGEELSFRAPGDTSEHGLFIEQTIPLGGKLGKSKRIFAQEKAQAESIAEAQRLRVLNSVRALYYETLGAQYLVALRRNLSQLTSEAVEVTRELFNVGQADMPDLLEAEIEAQRAENERLRAENDRLALWQMLAAAVGDPTLSPAQLAGNLEETQAAFDQDQMLSNLLSTSPEIQAARIGVNRARAVLARARAERIPNLYLRGGLGYNNERLDIDNRKTGLEAVVEAGINIPIFNRNQGGIAAAEAELAIAEREIQRLELLLRSRFSLAVRGYRNSVQVVEKYRNEIIPNARRAYHMYLGNFRQMAASYPQVLIAQRTLFQVQVEYARALVELRQSMVGLRGYLLGGTGLDAINRAGETSDRESTEGFTLRSGNEASGDSDD